MGYMLFGVSLSSYYSLLIKSHLQSYPCPLQINFFWNFGFLLGVAIILQIITGILLSLHYTSDISGAYFSIFFIIREVFFGWYLRSSGASFVFLFVFLHIGRGMFYGSYFYNPNTWFSGIVLLPNKNAFISLEISLQFIILSSLSSFILAVAFISLQIKEFRIMGLSINDSVYSSLFFF